MVVNIDEPNTSAFFSTSTIGSAVTQLVKAVNAVVAPLSSSVTKDAQLNSKRSQKRVQAKVGEVSTSPETIKRLEKEELCRNDKKDIPVCKKSQEEKFFRIEIEQQSSKSL